MLDGVNFTGANLHGVNFTAAVITDVTGLSKDSIRDACGDEATQLDGGFELPVCSQRSSPGSNNGDGFRFGWRVSRDGDTGTTIRLEADDGRIVELLSGNGAIPHIRGEGFNEDARHDVAAATRRDIERAARDIRRAQLEQQAARAESERARTEARAEASAEARAHARIEAQVEAQRAEIERHVDEAQRQQRLIFERHGNGEHRIWLTPAPNTAPPAPSPPPQPDH